MIGIIDYKVGNLLSVKNALKKLGYRSKYVSNGYEFNDLERLILPGVGSFGYCMKNIQKQKLEEPIKNFIDNGKPFLGICIGMQLLFTESEESPGVRGLNILKGEVKKFQNRRVPQIGWNKIIPTDQYILKEGYAYFVNSYYVKPNNGNIVVSNTDYEGEFVSAIKHENIFATQFHPEKSGEYGLRLLKRWLEC